MHADATNLPFQLNEHFHGFNVVWTVQTFQHIPDFSKAVYEAYRVLLNGGCFANYSLHNTPLNRFIYMCLRKNFHIKGDVVGSYFLERANKNQLEIISKIFMHTNIEDRYTECLFHPDLKLGFTGRINNIFGKIDILISKFPLLGYFFGRQRAFIVIKSKF